MYLFVNPKTKTKKSLIINTSLLFLSLLIMVMSIFLYADWQRNKDNYKKVIYSFSK